MNRSKSTAALAAILMALAAAPAASAPPAYSLIVRGGTIYDGSGGAPFTGDVAVAGDRIAAVAPHVAGSAVREIDAAGLAVAPGFINMLAHPEDSLIADGRAQSDLRQGVTLEVIGEDSMGPLSPKMKALAPSARATSATRSIGRPWANTWRAWKTAASR